MGKNVLRFSSAVPKRTIERVTKGMVVGIGLMPGTLSSFPLANVDSRSANNINMFAKTYAKESGIHRSSYNKYFNILKNSLFQCVGLACCCVACRFVKKHAPLFAKTGPNQCPQTLNIGHSFGDSTLRPICLRGCPAMNLRADFAAPWTRYG